MNLYDVEPFNHLDPEITKLIIESSKPAIYPAGKEIFNQSDKPTGFLYFIKKGMVEIIAETPEGVEMVVDYRKEGAFFGWTPIFTDEDYTAGARTTLDSECLLIPKKLIKVISKQNPIVTKFFSKAIYSQIRNLYQDMIGSYKDPIAQVEAYPFQKRLSEIMSSPVHTCSPTCTVREVAQKMTELSISVLLVVDDNQKLLGIITERDLVRKVLARDTEDCLKNSSAADIMTPDPYHMSPETFMYEAATYVVVNKIRHLPVLEGEEIVGIVTLQDLMKFRSQKSMMLVGSAKEAKSVTELKQIRAEMVKVAKALLIENRSHVETIEILSYIHHSIIYRCYELIYEQHIADGFTQPDINFCFIIMGSGGRKEMLLGPDQDNGFIYSDFPDEMQNEVDAFFIPFADKLVTALDEVGYPLCKGNVMVNNPLWRGRLKDWKKRIISWIQVPEPQRIRYSSIFFDFMPVAGEVSLCSGLRDIVHEQIRKSPIYLYNMMELDFKHKVPIGFLGRFITHTDEGKKGMLSLKENGSIFIVDCTRMFLLEKGIHVETTTDRLDKLQELKVFNKATIEHIKAAFESFTFLRLRNEINMIDQGKEPSHFIDPDDLSKEETEILKEAFKVASKLQDSTRRHFSKIIGR